MLVNPTVAGSPPVLMSAGATIRTVIAAVPVSAPNASVTVTQYVPDSRYPCRAAVIRGTVSFWYRTSHSVPFQALSSSRSVGDNDRSGEPATAPASITCTVDCWLSENRYVAVPPGSSGPEYTSIDWSTGSGVGAVGSDEHAADATASIGTSTRAAALARNGERRGSVEVSIIRRSIRPVQTAYISRRPSMALEMVNSSVYSRSLPTGTPMAMRVTRAPIGLSSRAR